MLVLCGTGFSADTLINLDMQKTTGNPKQVGPAVLGSAGDLWNIYVETTPRTILLTDLKDSAGNTTTVDFNFNLGGTGGTGFNKSATVANAAIKNLMQDYWYQNNVATWGPVSFSGIDAGRSYKLVCFSAEWNVPGNSAKFVVNGVTKALSGSPVGETIPYPLVENKHYAMFEGVVPASGKIDIGILKGVSGTTVVNGFQLLLGNKRGAAHTPVPTDWATLIDPAAVTGLSWSSPDEPANDPNITSVTGYDVYLRTTEPNAADVPVSTNQPGKSYSAALAYDTTYYWRVDTHVTWDSNSFTGAGLTSVVKGLEWRFKTKLQYTAPVLTFNGVVTTVSLLPAALSATVTGNSLPITSANFTLLNNDAEYPAGANAVLTPTTTSNLNPTATLTTDKPGKYKVKLAVTDGTTPAEKVVEVLVYTDTDACTAKKTTGSWVANYYDRDSSCFVNLGDFAVLAKAWLNDTGLLTQQTYTGVVNTYVPKAIFDARIEAESVSLTDPNAVSDFPATDAIGIRITTGVPQASGNQQILGYTGDLAFAQYTINIPAAGIYDVHLNSSAPAANGGLSFGVAGTPALYGSVTNLPGTAWTTYDYTVHPGALTFSSAGPTIVRITWTGGTLAQRNLDWFTLVKQ
jgi:hypothetical protein